MNKVLFITGTDTGVGKTLLTVSLLLALRRSGVRALAMKPFCSGGWGDVEKIQQVQGASPAREALAPYYFPEPLAPLAAAREQGRRIRLREVTKAIAGIAGQCDRLIVEGAGGVLVPLGEDFSVAELIGRLKCAVVVVAPNKLGVINHTRLTVEALRGRGVKRIVVVLMGRARRDRSARSNASLLKQFVWPHPVVSFPYVRGGLRDLEELKRNLKEIKKVLASIGGPDSFCTRSTERPLAGGRTKRLKTKKDC